MKSFFQKFLNIFSTDIAMDLGTANTLLFTRKHGIVINEPSVVALDAHSNRIISIGGEAREYIGRTHSKIRVIRPLKDGVIADFDVTKTMISHFVRKVIRGLALARPGMVICIPSGITQVEKRAVIDAAKLAGAREVLLVEEPMAAAMGANLPINDPVGNMVLDIGGGTSEVAVISMGGVAVSQSARVAGDVMNQSVQRYIHDMFRLEIGENTAENVKILLGNAMPGKKAPILEVSGKDVVQGCPRKITISEGHVHEALREPINAVLNVVLHALERTPPELACDISSNGLLMAGGGSLLKGLDRLIAQETRLKVFVDKEPLTTVLRGTARAMLDKRTFNSVFIN